MALYRRADLLWRYTSTRVGFERGDVEPCHILLRYFFENRSHRSHTRRARNWLCSFHLRAEKQQDRSLGKNMVVLKVPKGVWAFDRLLCLFIRQRFPPARCR